MNKYFIQLFLKENTVILPGFGALTAPNGSLEEIMFLPYLKFDDGKLADFIVETEGINHQDAQNTIAKFIREMEVSLNKGESFDIYNFGSFFKNDEGEIEFKSSLKDRKDEPVAISKTVETIKPPVKKEKKTEDPATPIIELDTKKSIIVEEVIEDNPIVEPSSEFLNKEEILFHPTPSEPDVKKVEQPKEKIIIKKDKTQTAPKEVPILVEPTEEKKKRKFGFALWFLTILGICGITAGIYYFNFYKKIDTNDKVVAQTETNTIANDTISDKTVHTQPIEKKPIEKPVSEKKVEVKQVIKPKKQAPIGDNTSIMLPADAKGFFIIGGVYPSKASAEIKLQSVKAEGITGKILPQKNGKMYVSLADFTDRAKANEALIAIRAKGFKAWLLEK
jgi:hypothetical protein